MNTPDSATRRRELAEHPSFDDREGVLNDDSRNEEIEETDRSQTGLQGVFPGLDAVGGTTPARLQLQAQRRIDQACGLEIPGHVRDCRPARYGVDERLVIDSQRAFHRTLLGMDQPDPAGCAPQEKHESRQYDSPQELQPLPPSARISHQRPDVGANRTASAALWRAIHGASPSGDRIRFWRIRERDRSARRTLKHACTP